MEPTTTETIFTAISLIASVSSLVLAVLAIWIALYGKREAERTNQQTQDLLTEVRSDAKSIAQYAIPELKAYGDSVRRFVFQKNDTEPESTSLLSKVENVLTENMHKILKQIEDIREAKDITAVKRKLDDLETQFKSSQESVRKSVEDSSRTLEVYHNGNPQWSLPRNEWNNFLDVLKKHHGYKISDYGTRWVFVDPKTDRRVSAKSIRMRRSFSELGIGSVDFLNLVKVSK